MSATAAVPQLAPWRLPAPLCDDDLMHVVCTVCYPDDAGVKIALCGTDMTLEEMIDGPFEATCRTCARVDLGAVCPTCGAHW